MEKIIQIHDLNPDGLIQIMRGLLKDEFKQLIQSLKADVSDEYLTRKEAAEFMKTSETTLWSLDKNQTLPARRLGGKVLYLKSDLLNFSD